MREWANQANVDDNKVGEWNKEKANGEHEGEGAMALAGEVEKADDND